MISFFSFRESYFRLGGLFDWGYGRTQFVLSVSQNRYGFTLAGYQNEKSVTDPALIYSVTVHGCKVFIAVVSTGFILFYCTTILDNTVPDEHHHFGCSDFQQIRLNTCNSVLYSTVYFVGRNLCNVRVLVVFILSIFILKNKATQALCRIKCEVCHRNQPLVSAL